MTVTPDWLYGADTQSAGTNQFGGAGTGLWDTTSTTTAFTYIAGRVSGFALHVVESGAAVCYLSRIPVAAQHQVGAFWFRVPTGQTVSNNSSIFFFVDTIATVMGRFDIADTGIIRAAAGTGTRVNGPAVSDNAWHLLTFHLDTSSTTWTMHWAVDDSAQTNATQAGKVATDVFKIRIGTVTSTNNVTFDIDDIVYGHDSTEYPYYTTSSNHQVIASIPDSDGTHVTSAGSPATQTGALTNLYAVLGEFPATTTDYVRQTTIASGAYAELNFADATGSPAIGAVQGTLAGFSQAGTAPNNGTTVILDSSSNSLTTIYSGDMVFSSIHYRVAMITAPAAGWTAGFDGVKARIGFSLDATPNPRWSALMLEYVTAVTVITATVAVAGAGTVNVSSTLKTRFAASAITGAGALVTDLIVVSSAVIGSKWDTTDQEWDSATDEWDGTLVIAATPTGTGTISATLTRAALTVSAAIAIASTGEVGGSVVVSHSAEAAVLGEGSMEADATDTTAGIAQVVGTGTISGSILHIALPTVDVLGRGTIIASVSGTVIRPVQKFASYDHVLSLNASFDDTLHKGASRLGVKAPITKANNWFVGEDQTFEFTSITGGAVDNIAGWTIEFNMAPAAGEVAVLTIAGSITDASNGVFEIVSAAAGTASLDPDVYYYDVSRTDSGHNQVLAFGPANLQARVA